MRRREFLKGAACLGAAAIGGLRGRAAAKPAFVKAALVHLASNLWSDLPEPSGYTWWDRKAHVGYLRTEIPRFDLIRRRRVRETRPLIRSTNHQETHQ